MISISLSKTVPNANIAIMRIFLLFTKALIFLDVFCRAWIRIEPECGPVGTNRLLVRRKYIGDESACFILYPLAHPIFPGANSTKTAVGDTRSANSGKEGDKSTTSGKDGHKSKRSGKGDGKSDDSSESDEKKQQELQRSIEIQRRKDGGGLVDQRILADGVAHPSGNVSSMTSSVTNGVDLSIANGDSSNKKTKAAGKPRYVKGAATENPYESIAEYEIALPEEDVWAWSVLAGGDACKNGHGHIPDAMDPYNGALFRVYKDFGHLEISPNRVSIGRANTVNIAPKHAQLPMFLPAHREKIGVRFSSPKTGKSQMVDGQLNKDGTAIKVSTPVWDTAGDTLVQLFWCEIPKSWVQDWHPHSGGGILRFTEEDSMFNLATRYLDDTHSGKSSYRLDDADDPDVFDGAKKSEEYVDADGDHYVLSRKADSTIPNDSKFLRDLCILILACSMFSLIIHGGSALLGRHMDVTLGCLFGGSLVGPGGWNLTQELIQVESVAELGLVFLMFELGFSFSAQRIWKSWRASLAGGVFLTFLLTLIFFLLAQIMGSDSTEAILIGILSSVSSTAMVIASTGTENHESSSSEIANHDLKYNVPRTGNSTVGRQAQTSDGSIEGISARNLRSSERGKSSSGSFAHRGKFTGNRKASNGKARMYIKRSGVVDQRHGVHSNALISILVTQDLILAMVLALFPFMFGRQIKLSDHLNLSIWHMNLELWQWMTLFGIGGLVSIVISRRKHHVWNVFKSNRDLQQILLLVWLLLIILGGEQLGMFSKEVGAFIAGFVMPRTCKEMATDIMRPLKEFFMMIFFGSIGLMMRPLFLIDNFMCISAVWFFLTVLKFACSFFSLVFIGGQRINIGLYISLCLSHVGEFAFLLITKGKAWGILSYRIHLLLVGAATFSLFTSPVVLAIAQAWVRRLTDRDSTGSWLDSVGNKRYDKNFELATAGNFKVFDKDVTLPGGPTQEIGRRSSDIARQSHSGKQR